LQWTAQRGWIQLILKFFWRFDQEYRSGIEGVRLALGPQNPVVRFSGNGQIAEFIDYFLQSIVLSYQG